MDVLVIPDIDVVYAEVMRLADNTKKDIIDLQDRIRRATYGTARQRTAFTRPDPAQSSRRIYGQSLVSPRKALRSCGSITIAF